MPVIPPDALEVARDIFNDYIHNTVTQVRKPLATSSASANPLFEGQLHTLTWSTYANFQCSITDMLSGKVDRLFGDRTVYELTSELGIVDKTAIAIRYVPDQLLAVGVFNNLVADDEVYYEGEWWRVAHVIPDSEGLQHTAIATK